MIQVRDLIDCERYHRPLQLTGTPYASYLADGAPILFMDSRRWPFVQRISGERPAVSVWMPEINIPVPNAQSDRPCLLKSAQTVSWIGNSLEYLRFKGETIKWINERLAHPSLGISDVTIGVIMCLTQWEVSFISVIRVFCHVIEDADPVFELQVARGNASESSYHLQGLQRMISLRGGLDNIDEEKHFRSKLAL